jgi:GTPase Era involved in 16S rRNA processing
MKEIDLRDEIVTEYNRLSHCFKIGVYGNATEGKATLVNSLLGGCSSGVATNTTNVRVLIYLHCQLNL